jgi:hypothetical protein
MKPILFLFLLLFQNLSAGVEIDPSRLCQETRLCTDRMQEISTQFSRGTGSFSMAQLEGYSGGCYHISPLYNSEHKHYGAFIFERQGTALMTSGVFSFFPEADPYENMSALEIKQWLQRTGFPFYKTKKSHNWIELQLLSPDAEFHYWLSAGIDLKNVYLIGQQISTDYEAYIYCSMQRR